MWRISDWSITNRATIAYDERTLIDPDIQKVSAACCPMSSCIPGTANYRRPAGLTSGSKDGSYDTPDEGRPVVGVRRAH